MVINASDSEDLPAIIEALFRAKEAVLLNELEQARGSLQAIAESPKNIWFEVNLDSLWADAGERNVTVKGRKGERLENVIRRAGTRFMEVNKRSDVQARWLILALASKNGPGVLLPEEIVSRYRA